MSQLPSLKRIQLSDIQGAPNWFGRVILTINNFMQVIYSNLTHKLTFQDNFLADIVEVQVPGITGTTTFQLSRITQASGVLHLGVTSGSPTGPITFNWRQIGQAIEITNVSGLSSATVYTLRFLIV